MVAIKKLFLIDISSLIFRAYFGIRPLHNLQGEPTHAVYGVLNMLTQLIQEEHPEYLAIAYDTQEPSFRESLDPQYKSNRSAPPEDLIPQFQRIEELVRCLKIPSYRKPGVEADDLLATLTQFWLQESTDHQVVIVSGDKDLMQLVNDRVILWDTMKGQRYGVQEVYQKLGVWPHQVQDYLALVGDRSDHVLGVPGIGPRGASELLSKYSDLETLLKAAMQGDISGKKGHTLTLHASQARLALQLTTLQRDVPIEKKAEQLKYQFEVTPECLKLLKELDFHSWIQKWESLSQKPILSLKRSEGQSDSSFKIIDTLDQWQQVLDHLTRTRRFAFHFETSGSSLRELQGIGLSLCWSDQEKVYVTWESKTIPGRLSESQVLEQIQPFLEDSKYPKIGHHLKQELNFLKIKGISLQGIEADTMIASYVLDSKSRHDLKSLAQRYLETSFISEEQLKLELNSSTHQLSRWVIGQAWLIWMLWEKLKVSLEKQSLIKLFEDIDLPLVPILSAMECRGVCLDTSFLEKLSESLEQELQNLETRMLQLAPYPINFNSPKQIAQLLFEDLKLPTQGKTKTGFSTDAQALEPLATLHEIPRLLLKYREMSKLKSTYVDTLPLLKDAGTGRIHAQFHQTVTATGRLSSSEPNLQNIPIHTERSLGIRKAFLAPEGFVLLSVDYSQIELRLLAQMSQDPELVRAFQAQEDIHLHTACELYSKKPNQVTNSERALAKAINFGLMYGKTAFGLSRELNISRQQAQQMIQKYFQRYSTVEKFFQLQIEKAQQQGWVSTLLGRKRMLPEIHSQHPSLRQQAHRMAMNTPIQGTAADLMKIAMILLDQHFKKAGFQAHLIIQVHDELVFEVPHEELAAVKCCLQQVLEKEVAEKMSLTIPLEVHWGVGANWLELKSSKKVI